jgi:hypothetical protein
MDGGDLLIVEILTFFDELSIAQEQCFFCGKFLQPPREKKGILFHRCPIYFILKNHQ